MKYAGMPFAVLSCIGKTSCIPLKTVAYSVPKNKSLIRTVDDKRLG